MEETATAPSIKSVSTVEIYDRWAESYDALASPKGVTIQTLDNDELVTLLPEFLSLLGVQQTSVSTLDHQLRIVDFGCGTGRNTFKLLRVPHATIVGLDASPGMLDIARARYAQIPDEQKNVHVVLEVYDALATAEAPACARKANGVISTCVMQHLPLQAFFDSIKAMVLPGGYVLITDSHPELNNAVQIKYTDPQTGEKLWGTSYIHEIATTIESAARWGFDLVGKVKERNGLENMVGALAGNWTAVKCWYGMVLRRRSETRTAPFSSADYQFRGWMAEDASAIHGNLKFRSYKPKPWLETDVDIKIICCGVCGSDMHTIRDGYNATDWPCCPGHEVVGTVVKVGNRVAKSIKVGSRVGVGAQSGSCLECRQCISGAESYCQQGITLTYNDRYADGSKSFGGYSSYIRVPSHFVIRIPETLSSEAAAPMLCAGITVYSSLKQSNAGPSKSIGIVGIGGLGHFGLLFAKALGCGDISAISRTRHKMKDAITMGASVFIATDDDPDWEKLHSQTLDIIVSTVSSTDMPIDKYLQLLRVDGHFIQLGEPEDKFPAFEVFALIQKRLTISGSCIGSPREIESMLQFAAENGISPWTERRTMKECNRAVVDMAFGRARYRYVLFNEDVQSTGPEGAEA